jgi:serine/threonine-protein kinase
MSDIETDGAPGRKLTKTGMIFGTPEYMSPEQAAGKELDHRVDIYALGIILYECVAGRVPFVGDTFMGVLTQHLFADLPPIEEINSDAEVSPELERVIRKALAKDPGDRYQDTEELAEAIRCALDGRLSPATARTLPSAPGRAPLHDPDAVPRRRTPRWPLTAAFFGIVGLLAWVAFGDGAADDSQAVANDSGTETSLKPAEEDPVGEAASGDALRGGQIAPTSVDVHVASDPPGAAILLDDGSPACDTTPCTLKATPNAMLVLRAKLGSRQGRAAITPIGGETIVIELTAPKKYRPKARAARAASQQRERPARASDLKVPEWAQ